MAHTEVPNGRIKGHLLGYVSIRTLSIMPVHSARQGDTQGIIKQPGKDNKYPQ